MTPSLTSRKAEAKDIHRIVALLNADDLGKTREHLPPTRKLDPRYTKAFELINNDPNQYLMVVELDGQIVGTCHLTIMPSLTFTGSTRMQIEAVRVAASMRGMHIGGWMMKKAVAHAKENSVRTSGLLLQRSQAIYKAV